MKVLFVTESLGLGGAETFIYSLSVELNRKGCQVDVVCINNQTDLLPLLKENNVNALSLNSSKSLFFMSAYKLARIIKKGGYDVVHAHMFHAALAVSLTRVFGVKIPYVQTYHNVCYDDYAPKSLYKLILYYFDKLYVCKTFSTHIAVSNAVNDYMARQLGINNAIVIYNGVSFTDIDKIYSISRSTLRMKYNLDQNAGTVLIAGRLSWEKGHRIFLQIWPEIEKSVPGSCGVIVGDGPMKSEIEKSIHSRGLNIKLFPALQQIELFELMRACDVLIAPSLSEGLGMVVIEAMALGCPVVCSNAGGLPELIPESYRKYVVPVDKTESLISVIAELLNNYDLCEDVGKHYREHARQLFDIGAVANMHLKLYSDITHQATNL